MHEQGFCEVMCSELASQCTLYATQPTLHILSPECHTLCQLHYQNHGQEPNSPRGLTSLLEELERSLKKETIENVISCLTSTTISLYVC